MIVTLFQESGIQCLALPEKASGRYPLEAEGGSLGCVEGVGGAWLLKLAPGFLWKGGEEGAAQEELKPLCFYVIQGKDGTQYSLFTEEATRDRQEYLKYCIRGEGSLELGREEENGVVLRNRFVSARHARLTYGPQGWFLEDLGSRNGTFVNGKRVQSCPLCCGDLIYIMGFRIVVGKFFLAFNHPDDSLEVRSPLLYPFQPQQPEASPAPRREEKEALFYCSPHFRRNPAEAKLSVDSPPQPNLPEQTPLALTLGPAVTMGLSSLMMASVAYINYLNGTADLLNTAPTIGMSGAMLCTTILWPLISRRSDRKRAERTEERRRQQYRAYLDKMREKIFAVKQEQETALKENVPPFSELERRVMERRRELWERTEGKDGFLTLCLGVGDLPAMLKLEGNSQRFSVEEDVLELDLARLLAEPKTLAGVPITQSLEEAPVWGVTGPRAESFAFTAQLVMQLAALHGYDEVKLAFVTPGGGEWEFARWLPHAWDGPSLRMTASTEEEVKALSSHLAGVLEERSTREGAAAGPWYVLVVADKGLADHLSVLQALLPQAGKCRMSVICADEQLQNLPRECAKVIELSGGKGILADSASGERLAFAPEPMPQDRPLRLSKALANIPLAGPEGGGSLPGMVSFLEMYRVGRCEHLNASSRWQENNPVHSLRAPVGVGEGGELFFLDLHEKLHGPHGLVAGMTGSGKSEFIITYILSLAVNFSPDEVAFILIDYKGGGLAGAFENTATGLRLPHLAGTITNLDGSAIQRSLVSIQSELRRRQAIFNEARQMTDEGTIDIYKYQRMYRGGQVKEPLPHLFVISDEFAELKAQQPEFMEQLISTARIGRSLGIHLILATQKPAGVVNDQIWSNSRFHVCLKVQEKADSMEMLRRPDAASLTETGRFYLQVGFNELFSLGQSAWSGAPYAPADQPEERRDDSVQLLDGLGRTVAEAKPGGGRAAGAATQVVAVVRYLAKTAEEEGKAAKPLWLPPLPNLLPLKKLEASYGWAMPQEELCPLAGEFDDPANQRKGLLTLPFPQCGNVLVLGMTGSGKTTFLQTVLGGVLQARGADALHVYLMDFGNESLQAFGEAPQVGGVLLAEDGDRVGTLFRLLAKELERRKKAFAPSGGTLSSYRKQGGQEPEILVVLHNYAAFSEQFEEQEEALYRLTRDSVRYGVYFLMTANSPGAVRYRLLQNFGMVLPLQLNDRTDYANLFGSTGGLCPAAVPGRGLVQLDALYEFQTAAAFQNPEEIRSFCAALRAEAKSFAPQVPYMPEKVDRTVFQGGGFGLERFPFGISRRELSPVCLNLKRRVATRLMAQGEEELRPLAEGAAELAASFLPGETFVWDGARLWQDGRLPSGLECLQQSFEEPVRALFQEMVYRNNTYKEEPREFPPRLYLLTGLSAVFEELSSDGADKLKVLLEKAEPHYGIYFLLCGTPREMGALESEAWYKRQVDQACGVWAGGGIADQYQLQLPSSRTELYAQPEPGFGYVVRRARPVLAKLLQGELWGGEDDE